MTRQTKAPIEHTNFQPTFRRARELVRLAGEGQIDLRPPYQRASVWDADQRMNLVESWLTGVPTGTLILADRTHGRWRAPDGTTPLETGGAMWGCVDGQQRLTTAGMWFNNEFAVPASWFEAKMVERTEDTDDGPYVRHNGLSLVGQRMIESRALVQVGEDRTCTGIADEARVYLLVNGGGTAQTSEDMTNAARVASGERSC
jgi:hypothetical protein